MFVENVAVDPECQGSGLGRRLMAFAEDRARRDGLPRLELYTNVKMTETIPFGRVPGSGVRASGASRYPAG